MSICEDLQLHILEYIPDESNVLFNLQLVCKRWKDVLQDRLDIVAYWNRLDTVYWNRLETLMGKRMTDDLKHDVNCPNKFLYNDRFGTCINLTDCDWKILAPALTKIKE